jgi:hypothetical protein
MLGDHIKKILLNRIQCVFRIVPRDADKTDCDFHSAILNALGSRHLIAEFAKKNKLQKATFLKPRDSRAYAQGRGIHPAST